MMAFAKLIRRLVQQSYLTNRRIMFLLHLCHLAVLLVMSQGLCLTAPVLAMYV